MHTQDDPMDKRILAAFVILALCEEKEPERSRWLYFYLMDAHTGDVILLPDTLPVHVTARVRHVFFLRLIREMYSQ